MMLRVALVALVLAVAWTIVVVWERRPVGAAQVLASGLTLVTGSDCRLCPLAIAAAGRSGVPVAIIDIVDVTDPSIKSLPTALVVDEHGRVIARRSGRSAVSAMPELIALARAQA